MALGTDHLSATTLAGVIPEIWGAKMNDFYRANLVAGAFFTDLSDELADGGDILHIPQTSEMSANTKGNGSQVTLNTVTDSNIDLTVTTWQEVSFLIEDREAQTVLHSYRMQERYMKNAAYTAAAKLEDAILDLFAGFSQTVGASELPVRDSHVRAAIKYLDAANVPQEDRAFFFTPKAVWSDLMAIDRFSLLQNTAAADPIQKGHMGYLYGIPVLMTTRIGVTTGEGDRNDSSSQGCNCSRINHHENTG